MTIDVDSSPELSKSTRSILALPKFGGPRKRRASNAVEEITASSSSGISEGGMRRLTTADKAIKRLILKRPRRGPDGAKMRKREKRALSSNRLRRIKQGMRRPEKARTASKARLKDVEKDGSAHRDGLLGKLTKHAADSIRGKRSYTPALLERIAAIGTAPSAGGSRSSIGTTLSHVGGQIVCNSSPARPLVWGYKRLRN